MQFTTDEQHQKTLAILAEIRDYLNKLPAHPMHRQMMAKATAHLENPSHRLVLEHGQKRVAQAFTASGQVILTAEVQGDSLSIFSGESKSVAGDDVLLVSLKRGLKLRLSPQD